MKLFFLVSLLLLLINCSFDNKTGIWKNEGVEISKKKSQFSDFKNLSDFRDEFNKTIAFDKNFVFKISPPVNNYEWNDIFFKDNNNLSNFEYNDTNKIKFFGKKLSKNKIDTYFLIKNNNLITSDNKGNIIIFEINKNLISQKFNFYKKKYKKIKKKLNLKLEDNIIYVSDNLGYLYAYDYYDEKILWAKNYKIPFRSNIKITKNYLITSNQDNNLIFFDKNNGNILRLVPTEENIVKNQFINNISLNENNLFFLNSFGSLYSVNLKNFELNWFINLKNNLDTNTLNLFSGSQIVNKDGKIAISSNQNTYIIDSINGSVLYKKNFSNIVRPIIYNDYIFYLTENNFLICMNINDGKLIYSYELDQIVANFLNSTKKKIIIKSFLIMNNDIYIFLENSYILKLKISGDLFKIEKLPKKIDSTPIIIDRSLIYLNKQRRVVVVN